MLSIFLVVLTHQVQVPFSPPGLPPLRPSRPYRWCSIPVHTFVRLSLESALYAQLQKPETCLISYAILEQHSATVESTGNLSSSPGFAAY